MQKEYVRQWNDESVNGIVIGAVTFPYEFWIDEPRREYQHKTGVPTRRVDKGFFENDEQAIAWFKENYPAEFKHGVEMRVFE
jgi:hypothetical protein